MIIAGLEADTAPVVAKIYDSHKYDINPKQETYWALMRQFGKEEGRRIHNMAKTVFFPEDAEEKTIHSKKTIGSTSSVAQSKGLPAKMQDSMIRDDYIVLDTETTGLSPQNDRVIEVSAYKYENGVLTDTFVTLINPGRKIPYRITEITGITTYDVEYKPRFREIARELKAFINKFPVVGHNAKFDYNFLVAECKRSGIKLDYEMIDTVKLARCCFPGLLNYKLETLIDRLNLLDHAQDHRAESDVIATAELYEQCKRKMHSST